MKSLFKIQEDYLSLMAELTTTEGELTPEIEEQLQINQDQIETKAENYAAIIRKFEGENKLIDEEVKRLQALKKTNVNAISRLKNSLMNAFNLFGLTKIDLPTVKIGTRKSKSVQIDCDLENLPEELTKTEVKMISKTEIKAKILEGNVYEGISIVENKSISIR